MSEKLFQERRNMKKTKVTLRSLAQELGIAPATVLRALTNHPNVTQGLRRRVIALAQKYHYQLPEHYKKLVAVVIPGFEFEGYTGLLLSSLMKELSANQFHGEIISDCDLEVLQDHVYAGVISIVWTAGLEKQWPEEHATPLVVLNATSNPREGVCQVTSDEKQGITLGLEQLYNKGRRRIAFVSSQLNCSLNARKRVEAFHEFCRKRESPQAPSMRNILQIMIWMQSRTISYGKRRTPSLQQARLMHRSCSSGFPATESGYRMTCPCWRWNIMQSRPLRFRL